MFKLDMLKSRKTREMALDMFIAVAVPLLVQGFVAEWKKIKPYLMNTMSHLGRRAKNKYGRTIAYQKVSKL